MPQTTQIIPKWTFPHVETYVNDYTYVNDEADMASDDTSVKQAYAFTSGKGIDNTWVLKRSRESAVKTFGDSNFKLYGQPLMQALNVVSLDDSSVWMMRVMPDDAKYACRDVVAGYKSDIRFDSEGKNPTAPVDTAVEDLRFNIKLTAKDLPNPEKLTSIAKFNSIDDGTIVDPEMTESLRIMRVRSNGRGKYGNKYSVRITKNANYEKEFGIKLYNFEILNSEAGLEKDANYIASAITSAKYYNDGVTLINDVLDEVEVGVAPVDIRINEDNIELIYDEYVKFMNAWHKLAVSALNNISKESDGTYSAENQKRVDKLELIVKNTLEYNIVPLDRFDVFLGELTDAEGYIPGLSFVAPTAGVQSDIIDFNSTIGLELTQGYDGDTKEDTITDCLKKAYDGTYDKRILSKRRMSLNAIFDANYPVAVKEVMAGIVDTETAVRDDFRVYLDCGTDYGYLDKGVIIHLVDTFCKFDNDNISVDNGYFYVRDEATGKKCLVTTSYHLSEAFTKHLNDGKFFKPLVKAACQLEGHVRDSLMPIVEDYETDIKELLNKYRINYYEPVSDNVFQRATQNTSVLAETDRMEESNIIILNRLKRDIEVEASEQLYDFADPDVRATFINYLKAKYANWEGLYVEKWDIAFTTSRYEFNHQILHLYLSVTFRGLNKAVIVEIDLNKRQQSTTEGTN